MVPQIRVPATPDGSIPITDNFSQRDILPIPRMRLMAVIMWAPMMSLVKNYM